MGKPDETRTGMRVRLPRIEFPLRSLRARRVMPVVTGAPTVAAGGGKRGGGVSGLTITLPGIHVIIGHSLRVTVMTRTASGT